MMLKHDIFLIGYLENGLGFYRFTYNGGNKSYVGVMAQEVQTIMPAAVLRGSDHYLRVSYDMLGVKFQTYDQWIASGAHVPAGTPAPTCHCELATSAPREERTPHARLNLSVQPWFTEGSTEHP
ncbi:hypothetical protein XI09_28970 [Bradyrhizobium sp. CCBAU 11386]|nr:hypothetical protein [Bradyrhizobium sp. CCBAU 11386]